MLNKIRSSLVVALTIALLPIGASGNTSANFPEYAWQEHPSCALIWKLGDYESNEIVCNEDFHILTRNFKGGVHFETVMKGHVSGNLPDEHVEVPESIPPEIVDLFEDMRKCRDSDSCSISEEVAFQFSSVDLDETAWILYPLGKNVGGPVVYFFRSAGKLIAISGTKNLPWVHDDLGIFEFFIIELV
ncbi:hypothetical protein [Ruegeria hyattellae]|uniref:hypothetical protein n=1 Tax=Ruegeria hyattellae TaxID=3233337 RepID=UPI00355AE490